MGEACRQKEGSLLARCLFFLLVLPLLAACATIPPPCQTAPAPSGDVAYLVPRGWHTELGLPVQEASGGLSVFRRIFPGARALLFGFGKRGFFTAHDVGMGDYILGPIAGPGAVRVTALPVVPDQAGRTGTVVIIPLPPGRAALLSAALSRTMARDAAGAPRAIGPGPAPGSRFYAATENYTLDNTCNHWVARLLLEAGVPLRPSDVVLPSPLLHQAEALPGAACRIR